MKLLGGASAAALTGVDLILTGLGGLVIGLTPILVAYARKRLRPDQSKAWHRHLTKMMHDSGACRALLIMVDWKGHQRIEVDIPAEARAPGLPSVAEAWVKRDPGPDYLDTVLSPLMGQSSHKIYPDKIKAGQLKDTYTSQGVVRSWVLVVQRDKSGRPEIIVSLNFTEMTEVTPEVRAKVATEIHHMSKCQ